METKSYSISPKVSINMGVYNSSSTLEKSIYSLINQSFRDWELIVCDDGSTDLSFECLQSLARADARIQVIRNSRNIGLASTLNRCLSLSRGKFIARQDDDDFSHPNRLEVQLEYLESHPEVQFVSSRANLVDDEGRQWGTLSFPTDPTLDDLIRGSCYVHPAVMIRKSALDAVGGYCARARRTEDYDLWFRLHGKGCLGHNLPYSLYNYKVSLHDYRKRKYKYRFDEFRTRLRGYQLNHVPFIKRIWALYPLVVGLVPNSLMLNFHRRKFKAIYEDLS